jgi:hypothetical protein
VQQRRQVTGAGHPHLAGRRTSAITVAACSEWPATSPIATSSRPSSMVTS